MILLVVLLFMLLYPLERFRRSGFDRRVRWQLMAIRWGVTLLALVLLVGLSIWARNGGRDETAVVASYGLVAACYALGEWLALRRLRSAGIQIRETVRGVNY